MHLNSENAQWRWNPSENNRTWVFSSVHKLVFRTKRQWSFCCWWILLPRTGIVKGDSSYILYMYIHRHVWSWTVHTVVLDTLCEIAITYTRELSLILIYSYYITAFKVTTVCDIVIYHKLSECPDLNVRDSHTHIIHTLCAYVYLDLSVYSLQ